MGQHLKSPSRSGLNKIAVLLVAIFRCGRFEPIVFDLDVTQNFDNSTDKPTYPWAANLQRFVSENDVDYFRLLNIEDHHIVIGGADTLYNISVEKFTSDGVYHWPSTAAVLSDCTMKSIDEFVCHNYMRILASTRNGSQLVCGTNAFRPRCRLLSSIASDDANVLSEFAGTGLLPLDPRHNATWHMDGDFLYAATISDFAGTEALIFRRNVTAHRVDRGLRTQRNNDMVLNRPQFVGEIHTNEYAYFFFREEANEADTITTYSRVARVCKSDRGGPHNYYETEWTSFVKARLNCSIPEKNRPFYFDEIVAISSLQRTADGRDIFYATFVSEFNFLRHSVICAFELATIDRLFMRSDLLVLDAERQGASITMKWTRHNRENRVRKMVGQCRPDSRPLSEDDAIQIRRLGLIADVVPSAFGAGAVGIHRAADNYGQIAVLPAMEFHDGLVDVLYVATDHGNIIKLVNLTPFAGAMPSQDDPLLHVATFKVVKTPIRNLAVVARRYLIVVTDTAAYRMPLHACAAHDTCASCVASRDPHCVWHNFECTRMPTAQKRFAYQDVLNRRPSLCADVAARDGKEKRVTLPSPPSSITNMAPPLRIDVVSNVRYRDNYSSDSDMACRCADGKKSIVAGKCICTENAPSDGTWPNENLTAFGFIQSIFPATLRDTDIGTLPAWALIVIGFAVIQTLAFIYLCCKLNAARGKRRKFSGTSSSPSIIATVVGDVTKSAAGGYLSAYTPSTGASSGPILNVLTKTRYDRTDGRTKTKDGKKRVHKNHLLISTNGVGNQYDAYRQPSGGLVVEPAKHKTSLKASAASQHFGGSKQHKKCDASIYSWTDERAVAEVAAVSTTLGRKAVNRTHSFNGATPYDQQNDRFNYYPTSVTLDNRASQRRYAHHHHTVDRQPQFARQSSALTSSQFPPASSSEDSSSMSFGSTNVTHLSSFFSAGGETDPPTYDESIMRFTCDAGERRSFSIYGSTETPAQMEPPRRGVPTQSNDIDNNVDSYCVMRPNDLQRKHLTRLQNAPAGIVI